MKLLMVTASCFLLACSADTFSSDDGGDNGDAKVGLHPDASDEDGSAVDGGAGDTSLADAITVDVTVDSPVDAGPLYRRAFISSGKFTANLGGASGADALCNSAASAASLGGTWAAWLSTSSSTAKSRFVHSTVPWKLLDGTVIANDWSDLVSGSLEHNMNRDEHDVLVVWSGSLLTGIAWTSTYTDGTSMLSHGSSQDCSSFSDGTTNDTSHYAGVGYIGYSGSYQSEWWSDAQGGGAGYECLSALSLLCFEQ